MPGSRVLDVGCGMGDILAGLTSCTGVGIDISPVSIAEGKKRYPPFGFASVRRRARRSARRPIRRHHPERRDRDAAGHLGCAGSIACGALTNGRIIVTYYNFVWEPVLKLAEALGLKTKWPDQNWLSMSDIRNLLYLSGFEVFRQGTDILMPS